MKENFHLPSWMSADVAHSHETLLRLGQYEPRDSKDSYFLNSEISSYNSRSDAPKNRAVYFGIELDEEGDIIHKDSETTEKPKTISFKPLRRK